MDNIENNIINEQTKEQNGEINFNCSDMPISKPLFELKQSDTAFAACALVASVFTAIFGIFGGFAFGYLLSVCFMIMIFSIYFIKGGKVGLLPAICGLLSLANSAVFICTTNGSVRFFGVIISFLLSLVFFDGIINGNQDGNRNTAGVIFSAASTMGNIGVSLKSLFSTNKGDKKVIGKVMLGLVCAIPVLIVVVPLLISSDDAFRGMMSNIFSGSGNAFVTVLKAAFGVGISMFFISYGFSLKFGRTAQAKESSCKGIESIYLISFLSGIAVCYRLYLFSQLAYFFSAFKGFLTNNEITYAEYARKGFFEMCVIAVINLGIVFFSMLLAKKQNGKICLPLKAITTFISLFTLIIIATAISKMVLYIGEYGMTVRRVTTSAFMLFLSVVFIAVIFRIYINKINIVKTAMIAAGIIVLVLGTANVNSVCARYNYEAYKEKTLKSIDVEAMYNLGDEGIPYIVRLACSKNKDVSQEAQRYLAEAYLYDYFDDMETVSKFSVEDLKKNQKHKGFSYFNIPKATAYDELYKLIENNPQFSTWCQDYIHDSVYDDWF